MMFAWTFAARTADASSVTGATSLSRAVSNEIPSRTDITAMPWSPIVPDRTTWSPGRAKATESGAREGSTIPRPVVVR